MSTFNYNGMILKNRNNMPDKFKTNECNGAGSGWNAKIVPDTIYGLNIRICACIHDHAYMVGGGEIDKILADKEFLDNMLTLINTYDKWWYPHWLARHRAMTYYDAVVRMGDSSFNYRSEK